MYTSIMFSQPEADPNRNYKKTDKRKKHVIWSSLLLGGETIYPTQNNKKNRTFVIWTCVLLGVLNQINSKANQNQSQTNKKTEMFHTDPHAAGSPNRLKPKQITQTQSKQKQ